MKYLIPLLMFVSITAQAKSKDLTTKHARVIEDVMWAADKVEVPRELLLAVCWGESNFRQNSTHVDGSTPSYGICQIKLSSARDMDKLYNHKIKATEKRLENNKLNAFYAAKFLRYQLFRYDGDWELAVDAYNKGSSPSKNSKYVKRFNKNLKYICEQIKAK